jgi:peptidoglycan-associated lipoprotein
MKRSIFVNSVVLGLILSVGGLGCKHGPKTITPITGNQSQPVNPPPIGPNNQQGGSGTPIMPDRPNQGSTLPITQSGVGQNPQLEDISKRPQDREKFKSYIVYFEFDRSSVKPGEMSKLEAVADGMKKEPLGNDLLIEGHCDERGTEEYNRALGERRALALRESLINLGVPAERMRTISYGKDRPLEMGHNEEAWSKNRRGEFILLMPQRNP